jgi:cobalt/nickel transport system permease protein
MHPRALESPRPAWTQKLSASTKSGCALLLVLGVTLLPRQVNRWYLLVALGLSLLCVLCRLPVVYTLRRLLMAEFFIVGIALLSLFNRDAFPIFLSALAKSNLCVLTLLLLTWTTPFHEILAELRRLHFPSVMLSTLALMYRYVPVLLDESRRMQRARASRTFVKSRRLAWRNLSTIIGQLFIRSVERAERIYLAMCARGWK